MSSKTSDCELLAAKAVGVTPYRGCDDCDGPGLKIHRGVVLHYEGHGEFGFQWAPLADDGDCARLEAALETEIQWHVDGVQASRRQNQTAVFCWYADHEDKNAARRAASVGFAAEIGRSMP